MAIILTMVIVKRPNETRAIAAPKKWVLVYGRRKTGKTFIVENFIHYDEYFFVKHDRSMISKKNETAVGYETFMEILKRALADGKTVVIDEFHRLGGDFFDFLHYTKKTGKLILVSSTLFLSKKMFSGRSALLGFFVEVPVSLIAIEDCLAALKGLGIDDTRTLMELALLMREPIAIDYLDNSGSGGTKKPSATIFTDILIGSAKTIPALVGEIFVEEERSISAVYEGILRAIAAGHVVSSEISSYLFSRKLIAKDDPSVVQQHLSNLMAFGIIRRIGVFGKARFIYKHTSPLAKLFYYADEKYNLSERRPNEKEIGQIVDELLPGLVEDGVRELLANRFGLKEAVVEAKDFDIDACLLRMKKPEVVVEVKWKKSVGHDDIRKAEENLGKIAGAKKRLLFVRDKTGLTSEKIDIVDISDFLGS